MNKASQKELERLPGIGPTTAKAIIHARQERPFSAVDDLLRFKGIGPATLEHIRQKGSQFKSRVKAVWAGGVRPGHWTATIFPGPKGNFVFNASTIFWSQGLASPPGSSVGHQEWNGSHLARKAQAW